MENTALSEELIAKNKEEFLGLVRSIARPDCYVEDLVQMLELSDFFVAPVTTNAFRNYDGGLCEQALSRYRNLIQLAQANALEKGWDPDSLLIVGLFADLGKINYFEKGYANKKVYSDTGSKKDELGKFDWKSEVVWKLKEPQDRYVFGTLGQNAERILSKYLLLTDEESSAIINLHADFENPNLNLATIYLTYPLAVLLNCADKLATFIDSRSDVVPF